MGARADAADGTRARIVAAAEQLFAERGVEAVSLREIGRAAGARNVIAVQYHFEDRAGVVRAVLAQHRPDVEAARHVLLDQLASDGGGDLRGFAGALVRPLAAKLADERGRAYLQVHAELLNRPRPFVDDVVAEDMGDSVNRWRHLVADLLDEDATRLHRRFTAIRISAAELGRRAAAGAHGDDRLFTSQLVDVIAGLLAAPSSSETVRLAAERDAARRRRRRAATSG